MKKFDEKHAHAPRCWCGARLPDVRRCLCGLWIGKPRRYCSQRCRRRWEYLQRKIVRRLVWIAAWKEERRRGRYPRAQIALQIKTFEGEFDALLRQQAPRRRARREPQQAAAPRSDRSGADSEDGPR